MLNLINPPVFVAMESSIIEPQNYASSACGWFALFRWKDADFWMPATDIHLASIPSGRIRVRLVGTRKTYCARLYIEKGEDGVRLTSCRTLRAKLLDDAQFELLEFEPANVINITFVRAEYERLVSLSVAGHYRDDKKVRIKRPPPGHVV